MEGLVTMPAGDAQRTWFPEMVAVLRRDWDRLQSMGKLIDLRGRLDAMLQSIRSERGILPPLMKCPSCGILDHAAPPRVSVRALILALGRFGVASAEEVRSLEKSWNRYRGNEQLDLYGEEAGRITTRCSGRSRVSRPLRAKGRATRPAAGERER
jgi:hypothetical protein